MKQLFPEKYSCKRKRGRNFQELFTRADPYSIKSDFLDLNVPGYRKCGKKCDSCNNFADENSSVVSKATGGKYCIRRGSTCTRKNIYLALENKEQVLLCLGSLAYQIVKFLFR